MAEGNYKDIKAGVDGDIGDVPSPSAEEQNASSNSEIDDAVLPTTSYSESNSEGFNYSKDNETPSYGTNGNAPQIDTDWLHQVIETIISEKWDESMGKMGDVTLWKEKTNMEIISIKQELIRLEERFEQLQGAILGRVKDYDDGIKGVHTEMKALEKVFEKILEPLTSNIKELNSITNELKKHKK